MKRGSDGKGPYVLLEVRGSRHKVLWRPRCPTCGADREGLLRDETLDLYRNDCPACRGGGHAEQPGPFSMRYDVDERRIIASGKSVADWAIEVSRWNGIWTTTFYVGDQSFKLAETGQYNEDDEERKKSDWDREAQEHCMHMGQMFSRALDHYTMLLAEQRQ